MKSWYLLCRRRAGGSTSKFWKSLQKALY